MGKQFRKKHRSKNLSDQRKQQHPDDYFQYGPLEVARFGTRIVMQNNMTPNQHKQALEYLANDFPEICKSIDETIASIVAIIKKLPPDEVLKRAYWEMAAHHINQVSESDATHEDIISARMVEYIQSVIVSIKIDENAKSEITEEGWKELIQLVDRLFSQFNMEYLLARSAYAKITEKDFDYDFDMFYTKAILHWANVRVERYLIHEIPYHESLLSPHNEVMMELFGITIKEFIVNLQNIIDSLTFGIDKTIKDLGTFEKAAMEKFEEKIRKLSPETPTDPHDLMSQVIAENDWEMLKDDVFGRFVGLDLFDLQKITTLPESLLKELSYSPGEEDTFFDDNKYQGWPLKIWPIFKRPFIKLNGKYYCFELTNLFDNLYRNFQRIIFRLQPSYKEEWNQKQKEISEELPFNLLEKVLPGATTYHSVYYPCKEKKGEKWCESDGLLLYDDHLIILEVKAGAFTWTSPATDFPAYIQSIKTLVFNPVDQGRRTLEYLYSQDEVSIYDQDHHEIGKISAGDYNHITICSVTLDPFTEIAAQTQHLKSIGIDVGHYPSWSLSIDDLRIYSDIFTNPLVFLHFIEQRSRAFTSNLIQLDDEIDHLGLYNKYNNYVQFAEESPLNNRMMWNGFRTDVDRFYAEQLLGSKLDFSIKQEIPIQISNIVNFLANCNFRRRRKVCSILLNFDDSARNQISCAIAKTLSNQKQNLQIKPLAIHGEINICIFCWQDELIPRDGAKALDHAKSVMLINNDVEQLLLELTFDIDEELLNVDFLFLSLADITEEEKERLLRSAEFLREKRIINLQEISGKIGRNQLCPCGSGGKYKKCCM